MVSGGKEVVSREGGEVRAGDIDVSPRSAADVVSEGEPVTVPLLVCSLSPSSSGEDVISPKGEEVPSDPDTCGLSLSVGEFSCVGVSLSYPTSKNSVSITVKASRSTSTRPNIFIGSAVNLFFILYQILRFLFPKARVPLRSWTPRGV